MATDHERGATLFPSDYFASREMFRTLAQQAGWSLDQHPMTAGGPNGESLTIDVATWASSSATRTVIVSSGLHGVEGFFGAAVQMACLRDWRPESHPPEVRLVFVHALNPYGYAWLRRANEDNVDLNRNFLADGAGYHGHPAGLERLDPLLNPPSAPSRWEWFRLKATLAILTYGLPTLKRVIAAGQYDYPKGLFFGGHGPCESTRLVREQSAHWVGSEARSVIHLDFHTGLGESGEVQLLLDAPLESTVQERMTGQLGHAPVFHASDASVAYATRGGIGEDLVRRFADREYVYLCAEFGTHRPVQVLEALRAENRAHLYGRPDTASTRWAKDAIREAFCPASPRWREQVLSTGVTLVHRAVGVH